MAVNIPPHLPIEVDQPSLTAIAERHQVKELALFGSVLRDDFTDSSDIDMLVTFQAGRPFVRLFELFDMQFALEDLLHRTVDLIPSDALPPIIADDVLRERVVIYDAAQPPSVPHGHARRLPAH